MAFTYDRLGRQDTVTDAVGTRTFAYRDNVSTDGDLQLEAEDIVAGGGGLYSKLITRKYQVNASVTETPGRSSGFLIGHSGDPDADYEASYSYYSNSRMVGVVKGPGLNLGGATYAFGNGDLVTKTSFKDILTTKASATFTYEPYRDLLASVENKRDASPAGTISKYAYVNDDLGRRTSVVMTGSAFSGHGGDHHWRWGYNERSELTSADRCETTTLTGTCSPMTPGVYTYEYDPIGNRTDSQEASWPTSYTTNSVNQYTARYATGHFFELYDYDDDGNLVEDGQFTYAWDGENRLIGVEPSSPADGSRKVAFDYDYMSRRVRKRVWNWNTESWKLIADLRFVYDQWNVVLVLDAIDEEDVVVRTKYTWGLDLSGQRGNPTASGIHGAGGIGGLLAVEETATEGSPKYWFLHDANGNVTQIIKNTTDYPIFGHYEYDPYGKMFGSPGGYALLNPFRFSTKWHDWEMGLYAYTFRYYDPRLGRWLNRDPAAEDRSLNLYSYVANQSPNAVDPTGLCRVVPGDVKFGQVEMVFDAPRYFNNGWMGAGLVANDIRVSGRFMKRPQNSCCRGFGIIQIARENKDAKGWGTWVLDDGKSWRHPPWYPYSSHYPPNNNRFIAMTDNPGWDPPGKNSNNIFSQEFETCVVAFRFKVGRYAPLKNCVLGCFTWGYSYTFGTAGATPPHLLTLTINGVSGPASPLSTSPLAPTLRQTVLSGLPSDDFTRILNPLDW